MTKLLCFLMLTGAVMFSFDIRVIGFVLVFSLIMLKISGIQFTDQADVDLCEHLL